MLKTASVMALAALMSAACGSTEESGTTATTAQTPAGKVTTPLRVGALQPQTGSFAPIGASIARGVELGQEMWNADPAHRQIEVKKCDDQSTPEGAVACHRQLQSGVDVIVGAHLFPSYRAIKDIVGKDGPPLLTALPFSEAAAGSFIFQTAPNIDKIIEANLAHVQATGGKKVATITSNDQPGNLAKQAAAKLAGGRGITLLTQEVFEPAAQNLGPQAEKIAGLKPDAILSWTVGAPLVTVLRALGAAGIGVPVLMGSASLSVPLLSEAGAQAPKELLFAASSAFDPRKITDEAYRQRVTQFNEAFTKKFGQAPDFNAYLAADALFLAAEAGTTATSAQDIRKALEKGDPLKSVLWNSYSWSASDHIGTSKEPLTILRWDASNKNWTAVGS